MTGPPCPVKLIIPSDKELFPAFREPPRAGSRESSNPAVKDWTCTPRTSSSTRPLTRKGCSSSRSTASSVCSGIRPDSSRKERNRNWQQRSAYPACVSSPNSWSSRESVPSCVSVRGRQRPAGSKLVFDLGQSKDGKW